MVGCCDRPLYVEQFTEPRVDLQKANDIHYWATHTEMYVIGRLFVDTTEVGCKELFHGRPIMITYLTDKLSALVP